MKKRPLKLLHRSLDSENTTESEQFPELSRGLESLRNEKFSEGFTDSVMNRIIQMQFTAEQETSFFDNFAVVFRPIAMAAFVAIAVLLPFNMYSGQSIDESNTVEILATAADVMLLEELP